MHDLRRALVQVISGILLAAVLTACAHRPTEPFVTDRLVQVTAKIDAIDLPERLVSLSGSGGTATISVAPEVRNLEQVQVGDEVVVSYYEGIAAQMRKRGAPNEGFANSAATVRAPEGGRPARAVGQRIATTVRIESVDTSRNTVTFRRQDGLVRTLPIHTPEGRRFIHRLVPGDEVDVMYTEAMAIEVVPAAD
jgi:hypothetical protein